MIHTAAHKLEAEGFSIEQPVQDQDGTIAYALICDGETFVLVAKEYAYKGLASFMEQIVKKAASSSATLVFYEDKNETFTVFDADYYSKHGALSQGKSKTRDTRWLELPLDDGVTLDEYQNGQSPTMLSGDNSTLAQFQ